MSTSPENNDNTKTRRNRGEKVSTHVVKVLFVCFCHKLRFLSLIVCIIISVIQSIFKTENVSENNQHFPPLMSVIVHLSKELSDMSKLSTTSVVGA